MGPPFVALLGEIMTTPAPYALLLEIAFRDSRILYLKQHGVSLVKQRDAKEAEIVAHNAQQELLTKIPRQLKKSIDDLELQIRTLSDQLKTKTRQLELITSEKQSLALVQEVTLFTQKKNKLVDTQMEQWLNCESLIEQLKTSQERHAIWLEQATAELRNLQAQLEHNMQDLAETENDLIRFVALLTDDWLAQYTRMKLHMQDPIVQVQNGACGGCFYPLQTMVLLKTKRSELGVCTLCHRFLVHSLPPVQPIVPEQ